MQIFILTNKKHLFLTIVEGFTEAKIDRFGQAIVDKVIEVCNTYPEESKTEKVNECETK